MSGKLVKPQRKYKKIENSLKVAQFNAQSIRNKMTHFRAMLASEELDIIGITETWINEKTRDFIGEYDIPGYKLFKKDRLTKKGGGVLLYVRNHLNPTECKIETEYEVTGANINTLGNNMKILVIYRPPNKSQEHEDELYRQLGQHANNKLAVLMGDFNAAVNWDTMNSTSYAEGQRLIDFVSNEFLHQWVEKPTRGDNILDIVLTTEDNLVSNITVGESIGKSDHKIVRFQVNIPQQKENKIVKKLDYRRSNWTSLKEYTKNLEYNETGNIDNHWDSFVGKYKEKRASCIPNRKVLPNGTPQPKWFNRTIANAIRDRDRKHKSLGSMPLQRDIVEHKKLCRKVDKLVRKAESNEEKRVASASKENPKEFYAYVNSRKPIKNNISPLKDSDGNLVTKDSEKAELMNKYFTSVFTIEDLAIIPEPTIIYRGPNPLDKISFTLDDIKKKIKKLDKFKAPGPDDIHPREIKELEEEIAPHLYKIFRKSADERKAPQGWKRGNVPPIYKKGPKEEPGNYRPVCLTSVPCKIFESIIVDLIVEHIEKNNLLLDSQHGFRQNRSCLSNLLEFFHYMLSVYDKSRAIDIIYLDFQKAFDKVPHKKLMVKTRALGIIDEVADWIEDWLTNRKQRVVINGEASEWADVTSGVPQGSVLGPLLFLIYINDIDLGLTSKIAKFADDTKLGTNAANLEDVEALRKDLIKIGEWSKKWQMPFNCGKCKVMHIGDNKNPQESYSLMENEIESVDQEEDLGIIISKDLKFTKQSIKVEKKAQKLIGYIKRQFKYRTKDTVLQLYTSLVRPHLEYAVQFWAPSLQKDIDRLEAVQARATKLVPTLRHFGYRRRMERLNLFDLQTRRLRGQLIETFKILKGITNVDYNNLFTLNTNQTRGNGYKLELKRYNTTQCGNFFTYKIANIWNRLPAEIVNSNNVDEFKKKLDKIIKTI